MSHDFTLDEHVCMYTASMQGHSELTLFGQLSLLGWVLTSPLYRQTNIHIDTRPLYDLKLKEDVRLVVLVSRQARASHILLHAGIILGWPTFLVSAHGTSTNVREARVERGFGLFAALRIRLKERLSVQCLSQAIGRAMLTLTKPHA